MNSKNFTTGILISIAAYLIAITATADFTKNIGIPEKKQEPIKQEILPQVNKNPEVKKPIKKEVEKKEKIEKVEKVEKLEKVEKVEKVEKKEEPKKEIVPEKPIPKEVTAPQVITKYTAKPGTFIFSNPQNYKKTDTLLKATKVLVLNEETIETKKETRIKKKDGTFDTKITAEVSKWSKIKYTKNFKTKEGWVKSMFLSDDYHFVLPKNLAKVDFTPVEKKNYANNPKRNDVRGIYVTLYSISSEKKLNELIALTKRTPINAFVIDVKEDLGRLLFKTEAEKKYLGSNNKNYPIQDIEKLMKTLKDNNIYTIARIVSFKDPRYAKKNPDKAIIKKADGKPYTNSDGVIWVSAHDRNLWEYNVAVAKEAAKAGFNEIQFDYVRFPASNGGKLDALLNYRNVKNESKPETIQNYLKYARKELEPYEVYISADVYGQVGSLGDDMSLGQHWEVIANEADVISPMAYPSHYGKGVYGLAIPDANPYKTIYHSTLDGINRNNNIENPANIRPWLQAFTANWLKGHISYGKKEIDAQTKALKDLGIKEYLLWNPSNKYSIIEK